MSEGGKTFFEKIKKILKKIFTNFSGGSIFKSTLRRTTRTEETKMNNLRIRKHYPGCYRTEVVGGRFGQIIRKGRKWHAELRWSETGGFIRPAGIWDRREHALEELTAVLTGGLS